MGASPRVTDYVLESNSAQPRDKAFVRELVSWIRFSEAETLASMDGLFASASRDPSLPSRPAQQDSARTTT